MKKKYRRLTNLYRYPEKNLNCIQKKTDINGGSNYETLVLSIDFDECSENQSARDSLKKWTIGFINANPQYKKVILFIGSARQSVWVDFLNAKKSDVATYLCCSILGSEFTPRL